MQAQEICLLASRIAKGGTGMVAIAGQMLNVVLDDLKLNRNLQMNRVTTSVVVTTGTNGPFTLPSDYLRTYDMFYPLQGPNGMTQFLNHITMEQYDAEFKPTQDADYPYEFATDLSTQAQQATAIIANPGVISFNILDRGIYGSLPSLLIPPPSGGGSTAVAQARLGVIGTQGNFAGGTGYSPGDILTVVGGTYDRPAQLRVLTTNFATRFEVIDPGSYVVPPGTVSSSAGIYIFGFTAPQIAMSGGTGSGCNPLLVFGLVDPSVVDPGGPYLETPSVNVFGGLFAVAGAMTANVGGATTAGAGQFYIYPQTNGSITLTHRYMRNQPDIVSPQTSTETPWFPYTQYLIRQTAALMMGVTGDDREMAYLAENEKMLAPYLIMEGDESDTVQSIKLDPRRFRSNRTVRPTKTQPY